VAAYDYDLLVIGSGPGGQKAAIAAAKLGKRAAVVERRDMIGGVCINTGTIPSKTLREAVLYFTGLNMRDLYGQNYRLKEDITVQDLLGRTQYVIGRETEVIRSQLARNRVRLINGTARFVDPHTLAVRAGSGPERPGADSEDDAGQKITAEKIVIGVGTRPARPPEIAFDGRRVVDSDGVLHLEDVPQTMVVVGAGVIGIEYASMFAALGTRVTVVEARERFLEFCDSEIVEALKFYLRDLSVSFRIGEAVTSVDVDGAGTITTLASGKKIPAETVLYSAGRQGATDSLDLEAAGLAADARGRIKVDANLRTPVEHIYAVGDVIGFPALAATSMEQGRLASYHAFGEPVSSLLALQPIGIYTIPEISYCGQTEDELTSSSVPYEVGLSRYRELARGQIAGDSHGMLKLLVSTETRKLLGVHIFGMHATELIHIGQAVMTCGGTVDHLVDTVFNYPTLSEAYKVAALDVVNKMRAVARFGV
jgi:NAD(P) transhydrogenase